MCFLFTDDPIAIEDFADHVRLLHANDDYLFSEEYLVCHQKDEILYVCVCVCFYLTFLSMQAVEPTHSPTTEATRRPENITKNRYANITSCKF